MASQKSTSQNTSVQPEPDLKRDEILKTEFEYAANSAFQANEDRSKAASFFLVSVGSLIAAILGVGNFSLSGNSLIGLAGIFFVLTLLGLLTVMQLVRLRQAWIESAKVMNKIKDYYIKNFPELADEPNQSVGAFRWRTSSIPKPFKLQSVSFYTVMEVALLSGLTFGAGIYYLLSSFMTCGFCQIIVWEFTISGAAVAFVVQLAVYIFILSWDTKGDSK